MIDSGSGRDKLKETAQEIFEVAFHETFVHQSILHGVVERVFLYRGNRARSDEGRAIALQVGF
jgi:hypothetical protein